MHDAIGRQNRRALTAVDTDMCTLASPPHTFGLMVLYGCQIGQLAERRGLPDHQLYTCFWHRHMSSSSGRRNDLTSSSDLAYFLRAAGKT